MGLTSYCACEATGSIFVISSSKPLPAVMDLAKATMCCMNTSYTPSWT